MYTLVLDENMEREVQHRLDSYGHEVVHVNDVDGLGKGTNDRTIADYSRDTGRFIVTYDDDFVLEIDDGEHQAVLYFGDQTLSAKTVADAVHLMSEQFPAREIQGVVYASKWIR